MRADRLIAVLLLLQRHGTLSAARVAAELETSHRTARRDLEALALAGVPVYSTPGRRGGWSLVGGARTDLSGLTEPEVRALFALAGAGEVGGGSPEMRAALRKLLRALPPTFRERAESAAATVHVDRAPWDRITVPDPPLLGALREAAVDAIAVRLVYADRAGAVTERTVSPWGVVLKGPHWYLVAGTADGRRTFRVSRIREVEVLDEPALRPAALDLAEVWAGSVSELESRNRQTVVRAVAAPGLVGLLRGMLGGRLCVIGTAGAGTGAEGGAEAGVEVEISARNCSVAAAELAGYGDRLTVLEPPEVRDALARIGRDLVARYGPAR